MSTPITALLPDIRINEIRSAVQTKTGTIPFLLLPVRLETRFMQVQKKTGSDKINTSDVLKQISALQIKLIDLSQKATIDESQINQLDIDLKTLHTIIENTVPLPKEKSWYKILLNEIKTDALGVITKNKTARLQGSLDAVIKTILSLPVSKEKNADPSQDTLVRLKAVQQKLATLNNKNKTPFINLKNKKDLYKYVIKTITYVADGLLASQFSLSEIKAIHSNQTKRITEIQNSIKEESDKLIANLTALHKDKNWQTFVNSLQSDKITLLQKRIIDFGNVSKRLQTLPKAEVQLDEKDMHFHGIQTLAQLKRFNINTPGKFKETKDVQLLLAMRIKAIDKMVQANQKLNPETSNLIKEIYTQIKEQLATSKEQVNKYTPKNSSQDIGKNIIKNFIDNKAVTSVDKVINIPEVKVTTEKVNELWVRIYPDDIFVHTHEQALTAYEITAGKNFWKNWWVSSGNADLEKAAFRTLVQTAGLRRAAWIATNLDPRKNRINAAALKTKPAQQTQSAIDTINTINNALQLITQGMLGKTPEQSLTAIEPAAFNKYAANLNRINAALASKKFEINYVIQNLHSAITKLGAGLNILIDKRNKLLSEDKLFTVQIEALMQVAAEFEQLIDKIKNIEIVSFETFSKRLSEPFVYPDVLIREKDWSAAPHSKILPERFVVVTVKNNVYQHIVVGEKIPEQLHLGINPSNLDDTSFHLDVNGDLQIDEKLLWMTEYKEALKVGMAVTVPLTDTQALEGFDQVFVLGLRNESELTGKHLLGELFQNHIYAPDGMAFLKPGTPTNNTQKDKAGYDPDKDLDKIFDIEIKNDIPVARKYQSTTDGERLQNNLGITGGIFNKAIDAKNTNVSDALVMNRALWNGTLGHYMEEMWDGVFTYDNIKRTENYFTEHVTARGFLPPIRVGEQPYGILVTTAFSKLELYPGLQFPELTVEDVKTIPAANLETIIQQRFDLRLQQILNELQKEWEGFPVMHAAILNEGSEPDSYQKNYMNILGLHATSMAYNVRYAVNVGKGPEIPVEDTTSVATNFNAADNFGPHGICKKFKSVFEKGIYTNSFYYWSEENPLAYAPFKQTDLRYNELLNNVQNSRIFVARFLQTHPEIKGNTVDRLSPSDGLLSNNYINWLLTNTPDTILASNQWANLPDKTLLFMLLRQSLMQAYQEAALSVMQAENLITERNRRDLGNSRNYLSYDFVKAKRSFSTKWHYLLKNLDEMQGLHKLEKNNSFYNYLIANSPGKPAMSKYIFVNKDSMLTNPLFVNYPNKANHQKHITKVDEIRDAFKTLATITTKELDILLAEHMDLCSYRLDAWQLGFVNRRLKQHRTVSPEGINIGAFGWVENLKPDLNRQVKPNTDIPSSLLPDTQKPVYQDPDNQGFIHGPSIQHGIAAAILRAGYIADRKNNGAGSRLAVNLSSERVRQALSVIEGVKNGLEIGAILGFQFERGLHERYQLGVELDKYIQPFRKNYPLVAEIADTATGETPVYQSQVVNGLKLLEEVFQSVNWHENNTEKTLATLLIENNFSKCPPFITGLATSNADRTAIIKEIDRIADILDSIGDLVMSEGVYQIVKGNHVRAAAVLASVSPNPKTAGTIPLPEIIETPRSGTIVSQRVVLALPVVNSLGTIPGWENAEASPRAVAEPAINYWLSTVLGASGEIGCEVIIKVKKETQSFFVSLDYLKWQPIDYFFNAIDENTLIQMIAWQVKVNEHLADDTKILPQLKSKNKGRSFYETDWLIGQVRNLLNGAKSSGDHDFLATGQLPANPLNTGKYNTTQFILRVEEAFKVLKNAALDIKILAPIKAVLDAGANPDAQVLSAEEVKSILQLLVLLSQFGISNSTPGSGGVLEKEWPVLIRQLIAGYKEANKRLQEAESSLAKNLPDTPANLIIDNVSIAFKALFGKSFLALPQFAISNVATIEQQITEAFIAGKGILRNENTLVMEKWLHGISKVREKMYAVEMLAFGMESVSGKNLTLLPSQLSYKEGDYWLGIEYPPAYTPEGDKLSVISIQPENIKETATAILIDDWIEIIPNSSETTGLVFNYNQPNARPPQSLLLAVNPTDNQNWTWDNLLYTLRDTLALSKIRAVEPDQVEKSRYGLVLPSIVAEVVPAEVHDDDGNALGVQVALDFINNNTK